MPSVVYYPNFKPFGHVYQPLWKRKIAITRIHVRALGGVEEGREVRNDAGGKLGHGGHGHGVHGGLTLRWREEAEDSCGGCSRERQKWWCVPFGPWLTQSLVHGGRPSACAARAQRARGREREGVERHSGAARLHRMWEGMRMRGNGSGARLACSHHAGDTRCSLRHSAEQVADARVAIVEHRFGPVTGQFGLWAFNEVWSPFKALWFSFREKSH
jgi:hypothetical protein